MIADLAIRVDSVGKRYRLGERMPYRRLTETLSNWAAGMWRRSRQPAAFARSDNNELWALRDVSFEVPRGQVLGVIGRNGAGKSTLLKILSRITTMTHGQVELRGRVGSLLEVGAGFHPELTGRDNLYLNGAILGMKRREIRRQFDAIVDFAGIEKFLDTPVKRYSSGMYMRLAFAVAAHLECEIMLVDEVLAVGDAEFQKKCLGKMNDVAHSGRTVLFVSHNMAAVQSFCHRVIRIDKGQMVDMGEPAAVIERYYRDNESRPAIRAAISRKYQFIDWWIAHGDDQRRSCLSGDPCTLCFEVHLSEPLAEASFGVAVYNEGGQLVWAGRSIDYGRPAIHLEPGTFVARFQLPFVPFQAGNYQLYVSLNTQQGTVEDWHAQPPLVILVNSHSGIPERWKGMVNIDSQFELCQKAGIPGEKGIAS